MKKDIHLVHQSLFDVLSFFGRNIHTGLNFLASL